MRGTSVSVVSRCSEVAQQQANEPVVLTCERIDLGDDLSTRSGEIPEAGVALARPE